MLPESNIVFLDFTSRFTVAFLVLFLASFTHFLLQMVSLGRIIELGSVNDHCRDFSLDF